MASDDGITCSCASQTDDFKQDDGNLKDRRRHCRAWQMDGVDVGRIPLCEWLQGAVAVRNATTFVESMMPRRTRNTVACAAAGKRAGERRDIGSMQVGLVHQSAVNKRKRLVDCIGA